MLSVENIYFSYRDEITIQNVSFSLERGKCLSIIGESGCGKSTLLQLIYGLYDLHQGRIVWNGVEVLGPKFNLIPGVECMKYLAQDFDLMPYITVAENVGKFLSNINLKAKKARVQELLDLVEMSDFANVKAQFLSGGQMQRVAIARVLALEPELILLDEPFSHIDTFRKNGLRRKVFSYLKQKGITCIIASHDQKDVLAFSDQILVLKSGTIVVGGNTQDIYQQRYNHYVASLFDDVNRISSVVLGWEGPEREVLIYPHELKVVPSSGLKVHIVCSYFRGSDYLIEARLENKIVFFAHESMLPVGEDFSLSLVR